jgi:putative ABC transport system permease protein
VEVSIPGAGLPPQKETIHIKYNQVASTYFQTMGTRVLRGRRFDDRDGPDGMKVVLVNQTMAKRFWPNESPLGQLLRIESSDWQIAGIVEDGKINHLHETPEPSLYFPFAQMPSGEVTLLIETQAEAGLMTDLVKQEIRTVDAGVGFYGVTTLKQHMRNALYWDWMPAVIAAGLSGLGMLLAAAGLFGAVFYAVNRRRREFGVRMALGAQRGDVLSLVLGQGLSTTIHRYDDVF